MIRRIGRKRYQLYAFDIESHNDIESIEKQETSCWLWYLINENSHVNDEDAYGYELNSFCDRIERLSTGHRTKKERPVTNLMIYVFNLSFEWSFLLPILLDRGFTYKEKIEKDDSFVFNSITTKSCSSVWQVQLKFGKRNGIIVFRDLSKIYNGSLRKVAHDMGLETQKGDIDYQLNRLHGYKVTYEEREYCFKDTKIVMEILEKNAKEDNKSFFKSLSAGSLAAREMIRSGYKRTFKPHIAFRKDYPELSKEENDFLRQGVEGGICYPTPNYQFKIIDSEILHIDARQMHPSSAYLYPYPYGEGTYFKKVRPAGMNICAMRIKISYSGVRLHSVIKLIPHDIIDDFELVVWDFEIPTMKKCYIDFKYEIIDGYAYKIKRLPWKDFYNNNFENREKAKKEKLGFFVTHFKLLNNSSYGKLLEKPHNTNIINMIREDGVIDSNVVDKDEISENSTYTYLPVGSAIPARSRVRLIETALTFGWKNVLYFDTDSIFALKNKETMNALSKINMKAELGGWSVEKDIKKGQFTAPKRYKLIESDNTGDELVIKTAGVNYKTEDMRYADFSDVNIENDIKEVQCILKCKGGTLIVRKPKELKVQKKYLEIYEKNRDNIIR